MCEKGWDFWMIQKADWSSIYANAADAALAAREAEWKAEQSATPDRCKHAILTNGDPVCVCPVCKSRRECSRAIGEFDTFWRHFADDSDLRSIRDQILKYLPKVTLENGTECREEVLRQPASKDPDAPAFREKWDNADEFQRYLATNFLEIECRIDGDPPEASVHWSDTDRRTRDFLEPLTVTPEVTTGAASMSRRAYAAEALRLLDEVRNLSQMMATAPAEDATSEQEQRWLLECFAEIAERAFNAGVLAQASAGKEMEPHTLRGMKTLGGSASGAEARRRQTRPETDAIVASIQNKISAGLSPTDAMRKTATEFPGKKLGSIKAAWYRNQQKK